MQVLYVHSQFPGSSVFSRMKIQSNKGSQIQSSKVEKSVGKWKIKKNNLNMWRGTWYRIKLSMAHFVCVWWGWGLLQENWVFVLQ